MLAGQYLSIYSHAQVFLKIHMSFSTISGVILKMMKKQISMRIILLTLSLLIFSTELSAAENVKSPTTIAEVLRQFMQCDASMFDLLKKHPDMLGATARIESRGTAATFVVADPLSEKGSDQYFSTPLVANGLRLSGWHNNVSYDVNMGGFLFWGFIIADDVESAANKINSILPSSRKLIKSGTGWARSEIHIIGEPFNEWHSGGDSGTVAKEGTVERVLLLDSDPSTGTVFYCSLQGSITPPLLQKLRPDLRASEYPQ